jgi:hypothetical protein
MLQNDIAVAALGFLGLVIVAIIGWLTKAHAKAAQSAAEDINDAVNHRHVHGRPRIADEVADIGERVRALDAWRKRWDDLPPTLADGDGLAHAISKLQSSMNELHGEVLTARRELKEHVEWEMKHPAETRRP